MRYQELNGIADWWDTGKDYFSEAVEYASDVASDTWDVVSTTVTGAYDWTKEKTGQISDDAMAELKNFQKAIERLFETQKKVDQALANLPENSPTRHRLEAKRQESRGLFQQHILPGWKQFSQWAGFEQAIDYNGGTVNGMGALPLAIPIVLGGVAVALGWINKVENIEMAILNDPELKKEYAAQQGTSIATIGQTGKYIAWGLGAIAVIYGLKLIKDFTE